MQSYWKSFIFLWVLSCYIQVFVVFVIKPINMRMGLVYSGDFRDLNRFWSVYSTSCLWRTYFCDDNSGNSSKSDKRRKSLTFERIHGKNVSKLGMKIFIPALSIGVLQFFCHIDYFRSFSRCRCWCLCSDFHHDVLF